MALLEPSPLEVPLRLSRTRYKAVASMFRKPLMGFIKETMEHGNFQKEGGHELTTSLLLNHWHKLHFGGNAAKILI